MYVYNNNNNLYKKYNLWYNTLACRAIRFDDWNARLIDRNVICK